MAFYIHHLPGRLRIKAVALRRTGAAARDRLLAEPGVESARLNPTIGSLLIHYDPASTGRERLLALLEAEGFVVRDSAAPRSEFQRKVLEMLLSHAMERSALALIGAVL